MYRVLNDQDLQRLAMDNLMQWILLESRFDHRKKEHHFYAEYQPEGKVYWFIRPEDCPYMLYTGVECEPREQLVVYWVPINGA
jgi:hypothetical protein